MRTYKIAAIPADGIGPEVIAAGLEVLGVFHSHTHSEAYPSPTDIAQAPDPTWHYVLVSLRDVPTVVRSYRIIDGVVSEEEVGSH